MPGSTVREYTRAANKSGWAYLTNKDHATSTPQPGEVWEISFSAKTTSGSSGAGFWYRFRQCDENGAVTTTDASTSANITITFGYDDEGIRRSKTTNDVRTEYDVYDGTLRRMSDGTNTLQFVYGNGLSSVIYIVGTIGNHSTKDRV